MIADGLFDDHTHFGHEYQGSSFHAFAGLGLQFNTRSNEWRSAGILLFVN